MVNHFHPKPATSYATQKDVAAPAVTVRALLSSDHKDAASLN